MLSLDLLNDFPGRMHDSVGRLTGGNLQAENRGIQVLLPGRALGFQSVPKEG